MTFSALNQAELEKVHSGRIYFLYLALASTPLHACTGTKTHSFGGDDYLGIGEIAGISDIADASDIAARPITITLSGVDAWITEQVMSRTNYKGQDAIIYRGFLDENEDLVDDPDIIWQGRMDVGSMSYDETYTASMVCEPLSASLLRPNVSRSSDEDHQLRHPGDKFYEFLPQMEKKDVTWGGARVAPTVGGGGSLNPSLARHQLN